MQLLLMGVSGCTKVSMSNNISKKLSLEEQMIEYINGRYEDTFAYYQHANGNYGNSQRAILVTSEKYPDAYVTVVYGTVNGVEFINDNYLYFKYREQATIALQEVLENAFDHDFKLFYGNTPPVGTTILAADTTLDEYMSSTASWLSFTVVLAPGYSIDRNAFYENLNQSFASRNIIISSATVRFCDDTDIYKSLNMANLSRFEGTDEGTRLYLDQIGTEKATFVWGN